ncbi:MAG: molybdenum cofactor biosynthesis protein MoaE [Pseudomonadota bacterium]|nr:molybdenum cofactor biosynthesis protein MoaE [Pseudomonadota bacterium]
MIDVRVQAADFDPGRQLARLGDLKHAGVASFTGLLDAGDDVTGIFVDHYPALAKAELARIADEAAVRWPLAGLILIHRHGRFAPCDRLLFAGTAAAEPADALAACGFLVEALRTRAPFWRKDLLSDGRYSWREGRG